MIPVSPLQIVLTKIWCEPQSPAAPSMGSSTDQTQVNVDMGLIIILTSSYSAVWGNRKTSACSSQSPGEP